MPMHHAPQAVQRKLLYTVSTNQAALLSAVIPPAAPPSSNTNRSTISTQSSPLEHLYQRVTWNPDDIQYTSFNPQQAAAAIVDGDSFGFSQPAGGQHSSDPVRQQGQQLLQRLRAASATVFIIYW